MDDSIEAWLVPSLDPMANSLGQKNARSSEGWKNVPTHSFAFRMLKYIAFDICLHKLRDYLVLEVFHFVYFILIFQMERKIQE